MQLFSERYGYKKISTELNYKNMTDELKIRIWNAFYKLYNDSDNNENSLFLSVIWDGFFKKDISASNWAGYGVERGLSQIKILFLQLDWYEIYDFIEFVYAKSEIKAVWEKEINKILKEERVSCKFINGLITPITNEEEIKEITGALSGSDKFNPAREHLEKALKLFSDRQKPDYENSIKESISALESLAKITLNNQSGTLGKLLDNLDLHQDLKEGLKKIYKWTSDEGGVRHGNKPDSTDKEFFDEARFMLIFCSSCFNYLVSKYG